MITSYKCNYSVINPLEKNNITSVDENFIKKIFITTENIDINKIMFTNESIYSSSRSKGSKRLIDVIKKYYDTDNVVITDGTANIGTDAINLSTVYKNINAVEISKINFKALSNNINLFKLEDRVKYYNADINKKIKDLTQDIIYIDAPWGGPEYKNNNNIDLFLGEVNIIDFYLENKMLADTFIFKVPYNYNFTLLYKKVKERIYKHSYKKGNVIKYYLLVIKKVNI